MTEPRPYDHVRATDDASIPAGTYRVVGTGDAVTLLRVGDGDGRRATTGEVVQVSRVAYDSFDPAENPDSGVSVGSLLAPVRASAEAIRHWLPF